MNNSITMKNCITINNKIYTGSGILILYFNNNNSKDCKNINFILCRNKKYKRYEDFGGQFEKSLLQDNNGQNQNYDEQIGNEYLKQSAIREVSEESKLLFEINNISLNLYIDVNRYHNIGEYYTYYRCYLLPIKYDDINIIEKYDENSIIIDDEINDCHYKETDKIKIINYNEIFKYKLNTRLFKVFKRNCFNKFLIKELNNYQKNISLAKSSVIPTLNTIKI